ncbi:UNVERIFIED_CONTAM: hypothetical protein FKN15_043113 [Acipenser sinensis]
MSRGQGIGGKGGEVVKSLRMSAILEEEAVISRDGGGWKREVAKEEGEAIRYEHRREPELGQGRSKGVEAGSEGREEGGGSQVYRELGRGVDSGEVRESSSGEDRGGEGTEVSMEEGQQG